MSKVRDRAGSARPRAASRAEADAIIAERRRLARELHDGPVQSLWFLGVEIRRLRALAGDAPGELTAGLQALQATWAQVYDELRQATGDLHQPLPADNALVLVLEHSLAALERKSGMATELFTDLDPRFAALARTTQVQLIRIFQAALANVQRHSRARRVRVDLRVNAEGTQLQIEDDGVGFQPSQVPQRPTEHYGLAMMRERAESLGGRVEVTSAPGQGTRLRVWVPPQPV
ncbi:MAG TPA: sensor histidine kinase [Chloroflexota bacterium]|nr:sensor histidine kinase [Chloroflexota bacterium]